MFQIDLWSIPAEWKSYMPTSSTTGYSIASWHGNQNDCLKTLTVTVLKLWFPFSLRVVYFCIKVETTGHTTWQLSPDKIWHQISSTLYHYLSTYKFQTRETRYLRQCINAPPKAWYGTIQYFDIYIQVIWRTKRPLQVAAKTTSKEIFVKSVQVLWSLWPSIKRSTQNPTVMIRLWNFWTSKDNELSCEISFFYSNRKREMYWK